MTSRKGEGIFPYLLAIPALSVIVFLTFFPLAYNFYLSFFQKHAFVAGERFVGLWNYSTIIKDQEFWISMKNGLVYSLSTIVLQLIAGLGAALLLNRSFRGKNVLRGAMLFPYLLPTVVVVILWKWLLNASYGFVNYVLISLHVITEPVAWLSKSNIMPTLILISVWQFFPFVLVTLLARMQTIPEELYRAARIDGAGPLSRFWHITLPQLKNVLFTVILLRAIWMFTKFDTVWLLAGKEAVGKFIRTVPVYTYEQTFLRLQAGMGAALSFLMFLLLLAGSIVYLRAFMSGGELE